MRKTVLILVWLMVIGRLSAEDGYRLWLRYDKIENVSLLQQYRQAINGIYLPANSPVLKSAKAELLQALPGLLGKKITEPNTISDRSIIAGTPASLAFIRNNFRNDELTRLGEEGFMIRTTVSNSKKLIVIAAASDKGVLYGVFHLLRLLQTQQSIQKLQVVSIPQTSLRILNHWDNMDRTVERGYAGFSIWNWHTLPDYIDQRYIDYARANASIGINGTVLTNVNANAVVLTPVYLQKVKALADIFRAYGLRVYLTARFSAPIEIGRLKTADPLNDTVKQWWADKVKEIYSLIPDFGGFLVKANSEGQPGPQNYNRTHADGANMLAEAVAPYKGIVMWRAFVYSPESNDRFKQAYEEFYPLDEKFHKNVLVQVKNGPIDFQPREPISPLFGAMKRTPLMMEFQITQEYLGQATHLVYEAPMFKEVLDTDTWAKGKGSTVSKVVDGSLYGHSLNGMAGVSNIGNDRNWTGHLFGQANWYAFGRLCWNTELTSEKIADEWIRQTFSNAWTVVEPIKKIMLSSYETMVNYMTPLGLHHIMGNGHHYGPAPWSDNLPRPDWNPVYYHRADSSGIGFDRTASGTNALAQYAPGLRSQYEDVNTIDEKFLLWFHRVSWDHKLRSGRTLWEALCHHYNEGVDDIRSIARQWDQLESKIDRERFQHVKMLLAIQVKEAVWWRDACLSYFRQVSGYPIPPAYEQPAKTLEYYKSLQFRYAPGHH